MLDAGTTMDGIAETLSGEEGFAIDGEVGVAVDGEVGVAIDGEVGAAIDGEIGAALAGEVGAAIAGEIGAAIDGEVGAAIPGEVGVAIDGEIGAALAGEVDAAIAGEIGAAIDGEVDGAIGGDVGRGGESGGMGSSGLGVGPVDLSQAPYYEHYEVHRRLVSYAEQRSRLDVAESFDLVRAYELRVHRFYGCSNFYDYMERVLGYAPHTARERMRVARALRELPETTLRLAKGEIVYSHARELTRVATPQTEKAWLDATVDNNATQVQKLVAEHEYGDLPTDPVIPDLKPKKVTIELTPEALALWREARVALQEERGIGEISDADLVETMCRRMLNPGTGADRPANTVGYEQCPDCKRTQINGAGRMLDVRREMAERLLCDARSLGDLSASHPERVTSSVTPRMRAQVFARDKCRCQIPGCRSALHLEIHHIIPQGAGGPHALWNLILLCDLCRARHKSHYADYAVMPRRTSAPTRTQLLYAA